jgi:CheY-like chemotaxis protein
VRLSGVDKPIEQSAMKGGDHAVMTLLYVEDEPSDVLLVTRLLQRRGGVTLHVARSGARGVQLAENVRPDVVLLDLHLSDMSGETVLQRLRALPELCAIPVLVLSADASPARGERLRAAGVTAYMTKPLDVAGFFAHLDALESRSAVPGSVALTGSVA